MSSDLHEFDKSLSAATARVLAFTASTSLLYGIGRAFTAMTQSFINTEAKLKSIQIVLNSTNAGFAKFTTSLFEAAKNTGKSFDEVADAAVELSRQGLKATEINNRLTAALILSRQAGLGTAEAVSDITAALNTFNKESFTAIELVNKLSNVDQSFAVSSKDLAESIKRAGASAQDAGVGLDKLIALTTSLQQTTARGGAVIGNALKSIFTRVERSSTLDALEQFNVQTRDLQGNVLSADIVLKNLANTYKDLSKTEQSVISERVAGIQQINQLKALLGDLARANSVYDQSLKVSGEETNSAIERNKLLNQTLLAQINALKVNATQFSSIVGGTVAKPVIQNLGAIGNALLTPFQNQDDQTKSAGQKIGEGLLKGLGTALSGPGLILGASVLFNVFKKLGGNLLSIVGDYSTLNNRSREQANVQSAINQILASGNEQYIRRLAAARTIKQEEEAIRSIMLEQAAIQIRTQASVFGGAAAFVKKGGGITQNNQFKIPRAAEGMLPFAQEQYDINKGVGGASPSARPKLIPNFNFGGGKVGPVVANTDEYIVPNYAGGDGSAIYNRQMVARSGLPPGARKINAAGGFVPNYNNILGYHGTRGPEFKTFRKGGIGFHIGTAKAANERLGYTDRNLESLREQGKLESIFYEGRKIEQGGERVIPLRAIIKRPYRINDVGNFESPFALLDVLQTKGFINFDKYEELSNRYAEIEHKRGGFKYSDFAPLRRIFRQRGYDGLKYKNDLEDSGSDSYAAFYPHQLKSTLSPGKGRAFAAAGGFIPNYANKFLYDDSENVSPEKRAYAEERGFQIITPAEAKFLYQTRGGRSGKLPLVDPTGLAAQEIKGARKIFDIIGAKSLPFDKYEEARALKLGDARRLDLFLASRGAKNTGYGINGAAREDYAKDFYVKKRNSSGSLLFKETANDVIRGNSLQRVVPSGVDDPSSYFLQKAIPNAGKLEYRVNLAGVGKDAQLLGTGAVVKRGIFAGDELQNPLNLIDSIKNKRFEDYISRQIAIDQAKSAFKRLPVGARAGTIAGFDVASTANTGSRLLAQFAAQKLGFGNLFSGGGVIEANFSQDFQTRGQPGSTGSLSRPQVLVDAAKALLRNKKLGFADGYVPNYAPNRDLVRSFTNQFYKAKRSLQPEEKLNSPATLSPDERTFLSLEKAELYGEKLKTYNEVSARLTPARRLELSRIAHGHDQIFGGLRKINPTPTTVSGSINAITSRAPDDVTRRQLLRLSKEFDFPVQDAHGLSTQRDEAARMIRHFRDIISGRKDDFDVNAEGGGRYGQFPHLKKLRKQQLQLLRERGATIPKGKFGSDYLFRGVGIHEITNLRRLGQVTSLGESNADNKLGTFITSSFGKAAGFGAATLKDSGQGYVLALDKKRILGRPTGESIFGSEEKNTIKAGRITKDDVLGIVDLKTRQIRSLQEFSAKNDLLSRRDIKLSDIRKGINSFGLGRPSFRTELISYDAVKSKFEKEKLEAIEKYDEVLKSGLIFGRPAGESGLKQIQELRDAAAEDIKPANLQKSILREVEGNRQYRRNLLLDAINNSAEGGKDQSLKLFRLRQTLKNPDQDILNTSTRNYAGGFVPSFVKGGIGYHRTVQDFDKFDLSKLSGENGEVLGRAHYFANSERDAKQYYTHIPANKIITALLDGEIFTPENEKIKLGAAKSFVREFKDRHGSNVHKSYLREKFNKFKQGKFYDTGGGDTAVQALLKGGYSGLNHDRMTVMYRDDAIRIIDKQNLAGGYLPNYNKNLIHGLLRNPTTSVESKSKLLAELLGNSNDPLGAAILREKSAGVPAGQIRVENHPSLISGANPGGLAVTNLRDEPGGIAQGIARAKQEGRNPKTYGASEGLIPNYAPRTKIRNIPSEVQDELLEGLLAEFSKKVALESQKGFVGGFGGTKRLKQEFQDIINSPLVGRLAESRRDKLALKSQDLISFETEKRGQKINTAALTASFAIPTIAGGLSALTNPNDPGARKFNAVAGGIGTGLSTAAVLAGAGPVGVAIGGLIGVFTTLKGVTEANRKSLEEYSNELQNTKGIYETQRNSIAGVFQSQDNLKDILSRGGSNKEINNASQQIQDFISAIDDPNLRNKVINARTEGERGDVLSEINSQAVKKISEKSLEGALESIIGAKRTLGGIFGEPENVLLKNDQRTDLTNLLKNSFSLRRDDKGNLDSAQLQGLNELAGKSAVGLKDLEKVLGTLGIDAETRAKFEKSTALVEQEAISKNVVQRLLAAESIAKETQNLKSYNSSLLNIGRTLDRLQSVTNFKFGVNSIAGEGTRGRAIAGAGQALNSLGDFLSPETQNRQSNNIKLKELDNERIGNLEKISADFVGQLKDLPEILQNSFKTFEADTESRGGGLSSRSNEFRRALNLNAISALSGATNPIDAANKGNAGLDKLKTELEKLGGNGELIKGIQKIQDDFAIQISLESKRDEQKRALQENTNRLSELTLSLNKKTNFLGGGNFESLKSLDLSKIEESAATGKSLSNSRTNPFRNRIFKSRGNNFDDFFSGKTIDTAAENSRRAETFGSLASGKLQLAQLGLLDGNPAAQRDARNTVARAEEATMSQVLDRLENIFQRSGDIGSLDQVRSSRGKIGEIAELKALKAIPLDDTERKGLESRLEKINELLSSGKNIPSDLKEQLKTSRRDIEGQIGPEGVFRELSSELLNLNSNFKEGIKGDFERLTSSADNAAGALNNLANNLIDRAKKEAELAEKQGGLISRRDNLVTQRSKLGEFRTNFEKGNEQSFDLLNRFAPDREFFEEVPGGKFDPNIQKFNEERSRFRGDPKIKATDFYQNLLKTVDQKALPNILERSLQGLNEKDEDGFDTGVNSELQKTLTQIETVKNRTDNPAFSKTDEILAEAIKQIQEELRKLNPETKAAGVIPTFSGGLTKSLFKEQQDIARGVGGARAGDYAYPAFIKGVGPAVVNSGETIVRNFAGSGKDAVLNREMRNFAGGINPYISAFNNPVSNIKNPIELIASLFGDDIDIRALPGFNNSNLDEINNPNSPTTEYFSQNRRKKAFTRQFKPNPDNLPNLPKVTRGFNGINPVKNTLQGTDLGTNSNFNFNPRIPSINPISTPPLPVAGESSFIGPENTPFLGPPRPTKTQQTELFRTKKRFFDTGESIFGNKKELDRDKAFKKQFSNDPNYKSLDIQDEIARGGSPFQASKIEGSGGLTGASLEPSRRFGGRAELPEETERKARANRGRDSREYNSNTGNRGGSNENANKKIDDLIKAVQDFVKAQTSKVEGENSGGKSADINVSYSPIEVKISADVQGNNEQIQQIVKTNIDIATANIQAQIEALKGAVKAGGLAYQPPPPKVSQGTPV